MYETFEHTADLGLRVRAATLESLFAEAGVGLFSLIVPDLSSIQPRQQLALEIAGEPSELLLFDWLSELLYAYEVKHLLFSRFDVKLEPTRLVATAQGESVDHQRHILDHEVKAITYHGLKLQEIDDGWLAEVIVDI